MKLFAFVLLLLTSACLNAQHKVNYWMGGRHAMIYFDQDGAHYQYRLDSDMFWRASSSISDSAGNLLFYTNGYRVFNKNFQLMLNGDNLDIGDYASLGFNLLSIGDGTLLLPVPGNTHQYYLFHLDMNFADVPGVSGGLWPTHIFYSIVDMTNDSGNGAILIGKKDIPILYDTLTHAGLKAVRHGNGRDWWLLCHEYGTNRYYRFLMDSTSIHGPYTQDIGLVFETGNATSASPMKFSEDGLHFAHLSFDSNCFEIYAFDRCSGLLSDRQRVGITSQQEGANYGMAFAPKTKYLYVSHNFDEILQFDLTASDIESTRTVVGLDDGVLNPFPANYSYQNIGPDGKLYIQSYDSYYSLHLIHEPDSLGLACNFEQRGFAIDSASPSNFWQPVAVNAPNYSLGALVGSGCDTLTAVNILPLSTFGFNVYPNPFTNELQLNITGIASTAQLTVTNALGQRVHQAVFSPNDGRVHQTVDTSLFPPGVYAVTVRVNNSVYTRKVVKQE